jgi:transposase
VVLGLCQIWDQYDEDRDGWLTEDQLYKALRSVGIRLRKREKHELRRELEDEL